MFLKNRRLAEAKTADARERQSKFQRPAGECRLTVELFNGDLKEPVAGLLRISEASTGTPLELDQLITRDNDWYAAEPSVEMVVPQVPLIIQSLRGLETEQATRKVDLTGREKTHVKIELNQFYSTAKRGLRSGNTHLHLMFREEAGVTSHAEAVR